MSQEAALIFRAASFETDAALDACQTMPDAVQGLPGMSVWYALVMATHAFPGLQDFVSKQRAGAVLRSITMDLTAVTFANPGPLLQAAASLALFGAIVQVEADFDVAEIHQHAATCRYMLAALAATSPIVS